LKAHDFRKVEGESNHDQYKTCYTSMTNKDSPAPAAYISHYSKMIRF